MTQILRNADALRTRLNAVYTDQLELSHSAPVHSMHNNFLTGIIDVFSVMVHETDEPIARKDAQNWFNSYRNPGSQGFGPQLVVWSDGTVMSLVEVPYLTPHGNSENGRSIGVETAHLNDGRFGDNDDAPDLVGHTVRKNWHELSTATEDAAGSASAKFFAMDAHFTPPAHPPAGFPTFDSEVVVAPWTTANYLTPARETPGTLVPGMYNTLIHAGGHAPPQPTEMIFTEWQYHSWALLARYLCESLLVPRNFAVMPHARRDLGVANAGLFKKLVLADENFDAIVGGLNGNYHGTHLNFAAADFTGATPADANNMSAHYTAAHANPGTITFGGLANVDMNLAWLRFFDFYRGIIGHGFSGNQVAGQSDHDCPGPLFDWHRFAREVWDWWWYPFDFDAAHATAAVPDRPYRRADRTTPLIEYFFYDQPAPYTARVAAPGGIQGAGSSPDTFQLEQNSPVYAMANGELVAARYPAPGDVSMAFVLVRHEVFHLLDPSGVGRAHGAAGAGDAAHGGLADIGRIDYATEPSTVYSLYMHLGRPDGMDFANVNDHNPDWLNRVLIRMAECDLAVPPAAGGNLQATLNGFAADLTAPPSLAGGRPTPLDAWLMDQNRYRTFLTSLAAGDVAVAPYQGRMDATGPNPIRMILGDYLGVAGAIRKVGGATTFGVRVEVFSTDLIDAAAFTSVINQNNWQPPAAANRPALQYTSEWNILPDAAASAALRNLGVDPALVLWWPDVALTQHLWDVRTPASAKLPIDGNVFHYQPVAFMQWLNDLTWSSEWPKFHIMAGAPPAVAPRPAAPRSRRV